MTYPETIDYLYSQLPSFQKLGKKAIKPKLTNIITMCEILGNPQNNFKSIHIAGTNGKGSSSHFLCSILMEAGYKVGLYTSPHLKDYRERFRINGIMLPENRIIEFVQYYGQEFSNLGASFFEVSVALAFKAFSDAQVDVAVIEVGLGGRLDSTNIISNKVLSLITNIGFDHTDVLGNTLEKIAFEKAGIIKPNVPVVISEYTPETQPVFTAIAKENNSSIQFAQDTILIKSKIQDFQNLSLEIESKHTDKVYSIKSGLTGEYQESNIQGVVACIETLNELGEYTIIDQSIQRGFENVIENTGLKGRWQILGKNPLIICDTGHNEHAFKRTIQRIRNEKFDKIHFILGFVKDKDKSLIQELIPEGSYVYLCEFDSTRAMKKEQLQELKFNNAKNISNFSNVNLAIEEARRVAGVKDLIFIGGSTYLVAEINEL